MSATEIIATLLIVGLIGWGCKLSSRK